MNINWEKWIIDLLPLLLRKQRIKSICLIMIGPIITLWIDFKAWRKQTQIKLGSTPQTIMLQKIIKDTLGIDASITTGNGKPTDFIVHAKVLNLSKEGQLLALLNRYKQAGKSYQYENSEIDIKYTWIEYDCEREAMSYIWSGYACEVDEMASQWSEWDCEIVIIPKLPLNYVYVTLNGPFMHVRTQYPATCDLSIAYDITTQWTLNGQTGISRDRGIVNYVVGNTKELVLPVTSHEFVVIQSAELTLTPIRDNTYQYIIQKTIK